MEADSPVNELRVRDPKLGLRKRRAIAGIIFVSVVAVAVTGPWTGTPAHIRGRGVSWAVYAEEPIPLDAIKGVMAVFTAAVRDILLVPTTGVVISSSPDDGVENYTEWHSGWRLGSPAGPVEVPVYFLTGIGWDSEDKRAVAARGIRSEYVSTFWGYGVHVGIEYYSRVKACCTQEQIHRLLHEFGHNLGLKDLYKNNSEGISGCEELPVIMAAGGRLDAVGRPPTGRPLFTYQQLNTSTIPHQAEVTETYFDDATGRLTRSSYTKIFNAPSPWISGWTNVSYDLWLWRSPWTQEQLRYLHLPWSSDHSCPQEGLP